MGRRLGHREQKRRETERRDRRQGEKRSGVAVPHDHEPRQGRAQRRAEALNGADRAEGEIITAGSPGEIGDQNWE